MPERSRPRRCGRGRHADTTTPPSVAAGDSDALSTVAIARHTTAPGPQHAAQPAQLDPPESPSQTEINARNQVELGRSGGLHGREGRHSALMPPPRSLKPAGGKQASLSQG